MKRNVVVETYLDAPPELVWAAVNQPRLLVHVAHPMIRFVPIRPKRFPESWQDGDYLVGLVRRGLIPIGKQMIRISHPPAVDGVRFMLDDGHGTLCRRWRHLASVSPEGSGTRYRDEIEVEAGLLTPLVAGFARRFYRHRQARWRALIRAGLDLDNLPREGA